MFKAHRHPDEDPSASQIQAAYVMPGPSDTFTIRSISKAIFDDSSYWLPSPVSKMLGYPVKICVLDVNDYFTRPTGLEFQDTDYGEPYSRVANRFLTDCDVWSERFGQPCCGSLHGTALLVCEDGSSPELGLLECMNAYIRKHLVLVENELERLRNQLEKFKESAKDVFGGDKMRMAWEEWKRNEEEAREKLESDRVKAERESDGNARVKGEK